MNHEIKNLLLDENTRDIFIEGEFWTSKQRQANKLHEISYRACFKPQLPNFFINLFTKPGEFVCDPFAGRGTTLVEAALLKRKIISNDINPLSRILTEPRICPPNLDNVIDRLNEIDLNDSGLEEDNEPDISPFYHPETEIQIRSLRKYLQEKKLSNREDMVDKWIRMVATNRLTGHSEGFFSVYTLPPNQAVTPERQKEINKKLNQVPKRKDIKKIIAQKSKILLSCLNEQIRKEMYFIYNDAIFSCDRACNLLSVENESVSLIVTSPPFLDVVDYARDNWIRCWFNNISVHSLSKTISDFRNIDVWAKEMDQSLLEFYRVLRFGGHVAFEVGEVKNGKINLEEIILPLGKKNGFQAKAILINKQNFTKTSKIWGIENNKKGTNTNRIVLFYKK